MRRLSRHLPWLLVLATALGATIYRHTSAVGEKDVSDVVDQYSKQLRDKSPRTRLHAVKALGQLRHKAKDAAPLLIEVLSDREFDVADAAARSLGQLGPAALPELRAALDSNFSVVRLGAAEALGDIGPEAKDTIPRLRSLMLNDDKAGKSAAWALARIGGDAQPVLLAGLKDQDPAVRYRAAFALGDLRDRSKVAANGLASILQDPNAQVRKAAIRALVWYGPKAEDAVPSLVTALANPDLHVEAAQALARSGPKAVEPLTAALQHADPAVRAGAAEALTYMGPHAPRRLVLSHAEPAPQVSLKGVVAPLIQALGDKEALVRKAAAEALSAIGPDAKAAVQPLVAALKDQDEAVRQAAAQSLKQLDPAAAKQAGVP